MREGPDLLTVMVGASMFVFDRQTGKEKIPADVLAFPSGAILLREPDEQSNKIFRLDESGRISVEPKGTENLKGEQCFQTEDQLKEVTNGLIAAKLVAIWNELPEVKPVRRFASRAIAIQRIWRVVRKLKLGWRGPRRKKTEAEQHASELKGRNLIRVLTMLKTPEGATMPALLGNCHDLEHFENSLSIEMWTVRGILRYCL